MISIICATNNNKILENELKKTLSKQTYQDYELIVVDTVKNKYESASEALNYGAKQAKGEYLFFTHHDIIMKNENELYEIVRQVKEINEFGIIGIAGISKTGKIIGNITNGIPEKRISSEDIKQPCEVQTLDEVFFIIKKDVFIKNKFDINNKTWHLYAVEFCLKMNDLNQGVYVIPSDLYHKSSGASMNKSYFKELKRICKIYREKIKIINTTMGKWHTSKLLLNLDILKIKIILKLIKFKEGIIR